MDVRHFDFLVRQPSAALTERPRFWGMPKRGIALILANAMFWQPLLAQADGIAVSGTTNTTLSQAGNGVPIVNIAAPNASGLSHNQYQQYNVGTQGVILNNATARTQSTQLGGIVVGNPNLNGRAASIILNEVTGANASQLNGYTEVAGQAAHVIVANPYGISCNGCGFINTPRATLTTGTPVLDNGRLDHFRVEGGSVSIEGGGLDASNLDQFDIITRSAKINAELHANTLNIIAGRNNVDAQTLNATALPDDGSAKPQLAIDSSALGGMYAGAIRLVGTEAGVGVKVAGNLAASAGDIQIDANGQLNMAQAAATGAVNVKALNAQVQGPVYGSSVDVQGRDGLSIQQNVAARDQIRLSTSGQLTNTAIVEAGVNADNSRNGAGDVTISAQDLRNAGNVVASRTLQVSAGQSINNQGGTLSGQAVTQLTAASLDNRQAGRVLSQGGLTLVATQVWNASGGLIASNGNLSITAQNLDNSQQGKISSVAALSADISGQLLNSAGVITASGARINAATLDNRQAGQVVSQGDLTVTAGQLLNANGGQIASDASLAITAQNLDNSQQGKISSAAALTADISGQLLNSAGVITANGARINAATLDNRQAGQVVSLGGLTLNAGQLWNASGGLITSNGNLAITAQNLDNSTQGKISSVGALSADIAGQLLNSAGLITANGAQIKASTLDNRQGGQVLSQGALTIASGQLLNANNGVIASNGNLAITAQDLDNNTQGKISSVAALSADISGQLLNNGSGSITANGVRINTTTLDNHEGGQVLSQGILSIVASQLRNASAGVITSNGNLLITAQNLDNSQQGKVSSLAALFADISGPLLNNGGGLITASGVQINTTTLDNRQSGQVASLGSLTITAPQVWNASGGLITSNGNLSITAQDLDNSQQGKVSSVAGLSADISGQLLNQAGVITANGVQLKAASLDNRQGGQVLSQGDLSIAASQLLNASGGLITSNGNLAITAQTFDNSQKGKVTSVGALSADIAGQLLNGSGTVSANGSTRINAASLDNRGGELTSVSDLNLQTGEADNSTGGRIAGAGVTLTTAAFNNRNGTLTSTGALILTAEHVDNSDAGRIASANALTASVTGLDQHNGGHLYSNGDVSLDLHGGLLNNQGGVITAPGQLLLKNLARVDNRSGEISSLNAFALAADDLQNDDGSLISKQALSVRVNEQLSNVRGLISGKGIDLQTGTLLNDDGSVSSDAALNVVVGAALSNQNGELSAAQIGTVTAASLNNAGGQITADERLTLGVSGAINSQGGTLGAADGLTVTASSLDNSQSGTVVSDGDVTLTLTGALNNQAGGSIQSKGALALQSLFLDNRGGVVSTQNALTLRSATVDNRGGSVRASRDMQLFIDALDNSQKGLISGKGGIAFFGQQLNNQSGLLSAAGLLQIQADSVRNAAGRIASQSDLVANVGDLAQQGGEFVAQGNLTLTGNTLDNSGAGLVGATKALKLTVGNVNNRGGELSSQQDVTITAQQLDNSDAGKVIAGTALQLNVDRLINRTKGMLFGDTLQLTGSTLDNSAGTLASQNGLAVDLGGALLNDAGLLSSEAALSLKAASLSNAAGSVSSAGALTIATLGAVNNQHGSITTDGGLTLASASLDNRNQGVISGKTSAAINTGAFDNSHGGQLTSADTLTLTAGQVTNQDGARIAATKAVNASVTGLDQQGGELFSNGALTLDLNHGQLNNQNGLINASGALLLKNLVGVNNQNGEISSTQGFTFVANSLDNGSGKLLSDQALIVRVAQALNNVKGVISAASLEARSDSLDNTEGLLSSRGSFDLNVSNALNNHNATLVADGKLTLNAASVDNGLGQIASKQDLIANIGGLQQQGGQLIALGALNLTGASLDNRQDGLVSANGVMSLNVGNIDNRGGELSSQDDISVTGQRLDNSDAGRVIGQKSLTLTVDQLLNRTNGVLSGKSLLTVTGTQLDNSGGNLVSQQKIDLGLSGALLNSQGLIDSEGTLNVRSASLANNGGSLSSAGALTVNSSGAISNQGGKLVTDGGLTLNSSTLDNSQSGSISGKGALSLHTGDFNNSQNGRVSSASTLEMVAAQVSNLDGGSIGSNGALSASVAGLDQQGGMLFSNTDLTLDVNHGQLNNQNGLINAPGILLLKNLASVNNQSGEISSAQGFTFSADSLDNSNGKLLSNQPLIVRVAQALTNVKGMIAAANLNIDAGSLNNSAGTLTSRSDFGLNVRGLLTNQSNGLINATGALDATAVDLDNRGGLVLAGTDLTLRTGSLDNRTTGLINSKGTLHLNAQALDSSDGGEVSAKGDMTLTLNSLTQNGGRLLGDSAVTLDLNGADLNNQRGLITAKGALTVNRMRDFNNQAGEMSSAQSFTLTGRTLDNSNGRLISNQNLVLNATTLVNQAGLISGWAGLSVSGGTLDNRNSGTLSSRSGDVGVNLTGALLNGAAGALVSQKALSVRAASVDNRGGILSSGGGQTFNVSGVLDNSQSGLIDSGAALTINAAGLGNAAGTVNAQQNISFTGTDLDNSAGTVAGNAAVTLDLLGTLTNTHGKLASAGDLLIQRAAQINNQGGQLASQRALTLTTGGLDNSNRGTVAANDQLQVNAGGAVQNGNDGLIYSKNANLRLQAASLANGSGTLQSQGALDLTVNGDIDGQNGRIIAQAGNLNLTANNVDNRGGVLSSLQSAFVARITGVLKNGYDVNRQGGITQAQSLDIRALAGIDNYGGRVSAQGGDALINTGSGNIDNRNGGLYARQRINVTGNNFDNSGDNDGQIAGQQIDLSLAGALNNRLGIIESDSTLSISAASLDNQTGKLRALGTSGLTNLHISGLFDNRNGALETANTDLAVGVGSLLNGGGSILHVGSGNFGVSTDNVMNAGGSLVTRGVLTLNADTWTNSSVLQAGTLNVNVNNFTQTAAGQLLASTAFVGTGGNWINDGLIASDGAMNVSLSGGYSGNGRLTSLGTLGLSANRLDLNSPTSIAGGGRTDINVAGAVTNSGRLTSSADLFVNAGSVTNYGTLGAGQSLTITTPSLTNNQGLIFSGANLQLNTGTLTNTKGDFYSLRDLTIGGYGTARADQVSNVSGSMESGGTFTINATAFENRTEGSGGAQNFAVGRTLVSGFIAVQCVDCSGDHYSVNYIARETFDAGQDNDTSASALMTSGGDFNFTGGSFINSKSTVSAVGNISIQADNVKNIGAVSGTVERTRTFFHGGSTDGTVKRFLPTIDEYNQRNNPDFPNVYYVNANGDLKLGVPYAAIYTERGGKGERTDYKYIGVKDAATGEVIGSYRYPATLVGYAWGTTPASQYNPANLMQVPTAVTAMTLVSDVEVAKDGTGNAGRSAVIQAGGNVAITATKDLQNSVIHEDYASAGGTNKVADTHANGTGQTVVVRLNAQLPPDLAQKQVDPTALPGFSLPTGQNGLFRLSGQGGSNAAVTVATTAPQSWTMTGASVSTAQRDQALPVGQGSNLQIASASQALSTGRQLGDSTRNPSGINADASAFNLSTPGDSGSGGFSVPSHQAGAGGIAAVDQVAGVASVTGVGGVAGVRGINGVTGAASVTGLSGISGSTGVARIPGTSGISGASPTGNSPGQSATAQTVARVQGLPSTAATARTGKYLIETNPVLTDLKQFMSSDYLLAGLGYNPDESAKRLGDGLYEQRLVQQAVTSRTGQAFIDGQTSNEDQFKYLMNNAIASKTQLNLTVGVSLTSEQVAALTHDIVWLEEREVNGENVLVPVLYLAQADGRLAPNGALIAGKDVTLIAGQNLDNVGTLKATNNLSATAGNDLVNSGLISAGNRLDLLAGNDVTNKAGGIIAGRDVTVTAIGGDVTNERSVTSLDSDVRGQLHKEYADNAARIEAANDLSVSAGRDINNIGSTLQAGRDITLNAGRDVNTAATQLTDSLVLNSKHTSSDITQIGSTVSAGRDLSVQAGRDINAIASQIDAKRDIAMAATEDVTISSAADEEHSYSKSKKVKRQEDHVSQVQTEITAGGSVAVSAGQNLAVTSSRIAANDEAYLAAGNKLEVLAAQDNDYSLYDMKKKGAFGAKKTKHDEVTDVKNIGSEITAGGNLVLVSGGDQQYQVAKLNSGKDLTINSGGAINFEGVKDLHQESHEKSNTSLAWNSMSGKGKTDETLRQSELIAKGAVAINAVDGLHIEVKQVNQQTVSQAIDAMVKADPDLAWLKDAEKRGDVDWTLVKEAHESFKYNNSGLGAGAQLAIAILVTYLTWGAGSTLVGAAANSAAGAAANSVVAAVATKAATSTVNNRGDLGAVAKDVTSSDSLKGYVIAGVSGGIGNASIGLQLAVNSALKTVLQGGKFKDNLAEAAVMMAANVLSGYIYQNVGDALNGSGLATKVAVHAIVGGLIGEAAGGDFRTSALAAGANEALVEKFGSDIFPGDAHERLLTMTSQLVGMTVAAAAGGSAKDQEKAGWVTQQATAYNYLAHDEVDALSKELVGCRANPDPGACRGQVQDKYQVLTDSKTGARLYDCKGEGESACNAQYSAAKEGSAKLDSLIDSFALNADEKEVLAHFQDVNHNDERLADHAWLQAFWGESGIADVVLGGRVGVAAAERAAAGKTAGKGALDAGADAGEAAASGAKATVSSPLKLGETKAIDDVSMTRVGRWMSPDELAQMQNTNKVVQGGGGQTFISTNGIADFKGAAPKGSVYVEFDVPANSLLQGGKDGWFKMIGPDAGKSQQFLLNKQGGEHLPAIKNIEILDKK
ncbi:filamentous hemagglutinin N-terminal domain-containing protein [Pseudomonas sp. KU26590]|uniref:two-partner secretion domain-containing protein n=3 Tax=Pseudomonas TaxID=286 RepID=UPI00223E0E17|nr:filamentous hemagglutinin N-terminal domain-containing protein [Pseudomonas sp. KU26590]UZJ62008.1 filamentous hemagglutinin N-terminal domain-containing protein [Pseudomonas sp. KU26590]